MKTSERFPAFAAGYIVIDDRSALSLRHAQWSRIFLRRPAALAALMKSRLSVTPAEADHFHVVLVNYIDADGVTVNNRGEIRMRRS